MSDDYAQTIMDLVRGGIPMQQAVQQAPQSQQTLGPGITRGADGTLLKNGRPPDTYLPIYDTQGRKVGMQPGWKTTTPPASQDDMRSFIQQMQQRQNLPRM